MLPVHSSRRLFVLGVAALFGGISGFAVAAPRASACECSENGWDLARVSVTSNGSSAASHERHWALEGRLTAYTTHAHVWFTPRDPETIHYVTSSP